MKSRRRNKKNLRKSRKNFRKKNYKNRTKIKGGEVHDYKLIGYKPLTLFGYNNSIRIRDDESRKSFSLETYNWSFDDMKIYHYLSGMAGPAYLDYNKKISKRTDDVFTFLQFNDIANLLHGKTIYILLLINRYNDMKRYLNATPYAICHFGTHNEFVKINGVETIFDTNNGFLYNFKINDITENIDEGDYNIVKSNELKQWWSNNNPFDKNKDKEPHYFGREFKIDIP